jgi:hypothetical protein
MSAWAEIRVLRYRAALIDHLRSRFAPCSHERAVIASGAFRQTATSWAKQLAAAPSPEARAHALNRPPAADQKTDSLDVKWVLQRIAEQSEPPQDYPPFPSTLRRRLPSFPFEPHEYEYLRTKADTLKGTEMIQEASLPDLDGDPPTRRAVPLNTDWPLDDDDPVQINQYEPSGPGTSY